MATETKVQAFVHALEEGGWVSKIRAALLVAAIAATYFYLIYGQFKGLNHAKAMDQAQIARQLSNGHGFTTLFHRPLAIWQFEKNKGTFPVDNTPDTYHAPLNPFLNSLSFRAFDFLNERFKSLGEKNTFFQRFVYEPTMTPKDLIYTYDRVIAAVSMLCFLISVGVNFTIAKRLFDRRLALLGMGLILITAVFWQFSISGLPQMLILLIFSACNYMLVRAVETRQVGANPLWWLISAAVGFGLMALAHALTIWIFLGALLFVAIAFWPRAGAWPVRLLKNPALIMLAVFLLIYTPWLVRTQRVCGNPFGVAGYSCLFQIKGTESQIMRASSIELSGVNPTTFRGKIQLQVIEQISHIYGYLGFCVAAPVFFLALMHLFKKPETAVFRWCVLLMWLFALLGMGVAGIERSDEPDANNLHVLFIPLMIFYGLAFVLVLWSRVTNERPAINVRLVHIAFIVLIYAVSALPFVAMLLASSGSRVHWPPYVPPFIAMLGNWTNETEVIASDMPWGVAWYADRKSLWLPATIADFIRMEDYEPYHGRVVGLYLTPVTGNRGLVSDIWKGEFKEWAPFILRNVNARDFPLRAVTALPIEGACVFYADRDRWSEKTD